MIRNFEELAAKQASCAAELAGKFNGAGSKRAIVMCGGTGCLSSSSKEIMEKFQTLIDEKGLNETVSINLAGCFGFCSQGPFVKIYPEDTLYRLVTLDDVEEIMEKDIIGGEIVERLRAFRHRTRCTMSPQVRHDDTILTRQRVDLRRPHC